MGLLARSWRAGAPVVVERLAAARAAQGLVALRRRRGVTAASSVAQTQRALGQTFRGRKDAYNAGDTGVECSARWRNLFGAPHGEPDVSSDGIATVTLLKVNIKP